ncbi:hypothetical protein AB0M39_11740 [Streptomyces sp. NPDC051907]|uniref:hypothetical protein n=1 Tax=Streptomyces sp. NPDC051907 TaxID=3155284 RepID=UPI0034184609
MKRRARGSRLPPGGLAGWLFADLMLVFVLMALGGQLVSSGPGGDFDEVRRGRQPTPSPTATTPTTSPSPPPKRRAGLDPRSRKLDFDLSGDADLDGQLRDKRAEYADRRVAMVFVFGSDAGCPTCAVQNRPSAALAESVREDLLKDHPGEFPDEEVFYRAYIDVGDDRSAGEVTLELFFFVDP